MSAREYTPDVLAELHARVAGSLHRWGLSAATSIRLINVSENATYLLSDPNGAEHVLRVHRVGYSSADEIRSELAWMSALRADGVTGTAPPMRGADGEFVQVLEPIGHGPPRLAVAFERLPGREPGLREADLWFGRLGEETGKMHAHAQSWNLPAGFCRKRWDFDAMVGPAWPMGPWRAAVGLDEIGIGVLEETLELIERRLREYGDSPRVFGLVHADLRLANLLIHGSDLRIIDFDDCGFGWFLYDFATAVSFIEHEAVVPALARAWIAGYRRSHSLSAQDASMIPTFVVLRRVLLTAWLASHAEVPFARDFGAAYTVGTVRLARELTRGHFLNSIFT